MKLVIGGMYNWKHQPERLVYIGKSGSWHQFAKVENTLLVWSEVLDSELHLMEKTNEQ